MTARDHNRLLGIFFAIYAALQGFGLLIATVIYGGLGAVVGTSARGEERILGLIFIVLAIVLFFVSLVMVVPPVVAAFKILKNRDNARFWTIFAAIVSVISFPFGTALGVYALWFLFGEHGKQFYNSGGATNAFNPPPPPPSSWR